MSFVSCLDGSLLNLVAVSTHVEMTVEISNDVLAAMRQTKLCLEEEGRLKVQSAMPMREFSQRGNL